MPGSQRCMTRAPSKLSGGSVVAQQCLKPHRRRRKAQLLVTDAKSRCQPLHHVELAAAIAELPPPQATDGVEEEHQLVETLPAAPAKKADKARKAAAPHCFFVDIVGAPEHASQAVGSAPPRPASVARPMDTTEPPVNDVANEGAAAAEGTSPVSAPPTGKSRARGHQLADGEGADFPWLAQFYQNDLLRGSQSSRTPASGESTRYYAQSGGLKRLHTEDGYLQRGVARNLCYVCSMGYHKEYECPMLRCRTCFGTGHQTKTCPKASVTCLTCHRAGHTAEFCLSAAIWDAMDARHWDPVRCVNCGEIGHPMCGSRRTLSFGSRCSGGSSASSSSHSEGQDTAWHRSWSRTDTGSTGRGGRGRGRGCSAGTRRHYDPDADWLEDVQKARNAVSGRGHSGRGGSCRRVELCDSPRETSSSRRGQGMSELTSKSGAEDKTASAGRGSPNRRPTKPLDMRRELQTKLERQHGRSGAPRAEKDNASKHKVREIRIAKVIAGKLK
mmetsp:Transcript_57365/g.134505  ORF Transcript_57365/g.134505 Transcript_57365/m.134505 type:complete len:500 (-) Transcript_57365:53-1552(-)